MKPATKFLNPQGLVLMVCLYTQRRGNKMLLIHTVGILQYTVLSRGGTAKVATHQKTSFTMGKYGKYYAFTFVREV